MKQSNLLWRWSEMRAAAGGVALFASLLLTTPMVMALENEPTADDVLKSMSDFLARTSAFSMNANIDLEVVLHNGQKLQMSSSAVTLVQRPGKFRINKKGMFSDATIVFDGSTLTIHGNKINAYYQMPVSGKIQDAITAYELETGIPAPGADLLLPDTYSVLSTGVQESEYVGTAYIDGIETHHLAFREKDVDWQLWVSTGDQPLPMKYVITTKWQTGAPQYSLRMNDWNVNPTINGEEFKFTPPESATILKSLDLDELGEIIKAKEGA